MDISYYTIYVRRLWFMKKITRLFLLLLALASLNVMLCDRMLTDGTVDSVHEGNADRTPDGSKATYKSGIAPQKIDAVIRKELQIFPIPLSKYHTGYGAAFEDSWMNTRTFGGDRGHEGTDIMLEPNTRGLFPVLSMTDGTVEKKGWLPQGGYRIGIRSAGDIYYYYAHLSDYADGMEPGVTVSAGQLLGFAGDSGYSNIEGTVGKFPVHLHVGIYYDDENGMETSVNPYPYLLFLKQVTIDF